MAVRVASEDDLPRIVESLLQRPVSPGHRWALESTRGDEDARRTLMEWVVHTTFDVGIVIVDDDGRAIGGRPSVLARSTFRQLTRGDVPRLATTTVGQWQYPAALSKVVHERLYRLAQAGELVTPPGRITSISFGLGVGDAPVEELWAGWFERVSPDPTLVVTVGAERSEHLVARGFERVADRHVRGEPTLAVTSWRHD